MTGGDATSGGSDRERPSSDGGPGNDDIELFGGLALGGDGDDRVTIRDPNDVEQVGPARAYVSIDRLQDPVNTCQSAPAPVTDQIGRPLTPIADGGPGNDTVAGSGETVRVNGGDGDDRLEGDAGAQVLDGGEGADTFVAGPGHDAVIAGAGVDTVDGGDDDDLIVSDAGGDAIAGGNGSDGACFYSRPSGVTVDLVPAGSVGAPRGTDTVVSDVELVGATPHADVVAAGAIPASVVGGDGADRLVGGPLDDYLRGGFGDDTISGAAGNDQLDGGSEYYNLRGESFASEGRDVIDGGAGRDALRGHRGIDTLSGGADSDTIVAEEAAVGFRGGRTATNFSAVISLAHGDQVWCGAGRDTVFADYADGIAGDCELREEGTPRWREVLVGKRRSVQLKVRCAWKSTAPCRGPARLVAAVGRPIAAGRSGAPADDAPDSCKGLPRRQPFLGSVRLNIRAGRVGRVDVPLSKRARRLVARRGCVAAVIVMEVRDRRGRRFASSRSLALRGARR
jgi:Ca2+-binding RTX toxin-like protein